MAKRCLLDGVLADAILDPAGGYVLRPAPQHTSLPVAVPYVLGMRTPRYTVRLPADTTTTAVEASGG
jgi:hypothetical protein